MFDDRILISEILSGNKAAFQTFIEAYQKLVSHVVFRIVANEFDREDLCQDVFLRVYQNLGKFKFKCKVSTWVAQIAYNTSLNYLEKRKIPLVDDFISNNGHNQLAEIPEYGMTPQQYTETRDLNQRIQNEVNLLPPQYGVLIVLYHLEYMSYEEIAEITNQPLGTVKSYIYRARRMLKDRLLEKYELEDILQ
ncbi:MAG: sigma-70 family RNA polymerase sigma factor [candidate division Zixibacteria bacterium]|nr:sigma-70 family RNA polymerase sigma factor [candidate division Zixibacteria bacterium]